MVSFAALMLWTIAAVASVAMGTDRPFDRIDVEFSPFQDPWPVINTSKVVYLGRISQENLTQYCVKSQYWGYEPPSRTVDRSLNVSTSDVSSLNISLNVRYEQPANGSNNTMLQVTYKETSEFLTSDINFIDRYINRNRSFLVLYSDPTCLILGDVLNATAFTNCSLWFPQKSIFSWLSPPVCCEFLFIILCGEGSRFDWTKSCKP
uniref:Putative group iii salivary lipocalin n=1 Tax=Rhipicephalus pulchellus TaxID=72859 RepID=L7M9X1_RHIPC